jgi:hypothetical protein
VKQRQIESPNDGKRLEINSKLTYVNDVYLEENADSIILTVERKDQTKRSVVLREPDEALDLSHVSIDNATINKIKQLLALWGKEKAGTFANKYIEDHRQEIEFFNDIVTLSICLSRLPDESSRTLKIDTATNLLHSRITAQIMFEYHALGFQVTSVHSKGARKPIHDFDISGYNSKFKGEVKTIQSFGNIEHIESGGYRLTQQSHKSFINAIRKDFKDAEKVGEKGITIVAPWSYRINALLRQYFKRNLLPYPPIPNPNTTILVLTSDNVFQDYYVSFSTHLALHILEGALLNIQSIGISPIVLVPIRTGFTIRMTTGPYQGSSVGYSF